MNIRFDTLKYLDWKLVLMYLALVCIGWVSIFAAVYDPEHAKIIDTSQRYGMQMIWILSSWALATFILCINPKVYPVLSGVIYAGGICLLLAVLVLGSERNGSQSWLVIGSVSIQPAEFMKIALSLALARLMSKHDFHLNNMRDAIKVGLLICIPIGLILLEKETGLALVFVALCIMLFREGLSGWFLVFGFFAVVIFLLAILWPLEWVLFFILCVCFIGYLLTKWDKWNPLWIFALFCLIYFMGPLILRWCGLDLWEYIEGIHWFLGLSFILLIILFIRAVKKRNRHLKIILAMFIACVIFTFCVDYIFNNVLQDHQRIRIENLLGIKEDIYGSGYNVHQSKVAIGSGGFAGKGFLQGTQTKFNFVPEQSTDFIFCTIGEEWGFLGSMTVVLLYLFFILRIINLAERQKDAFVRIYGYCVASFFFFHFFINIGMTIGLVPVIGIPLPFISYGGSSLWSFTILLFILLKMDTARR